MPIHIVQGDLRKATEKYICHQCNSITKTGANLAKSIFRCFPHADIYTPRLYADHLPLPDEYPGNIIIKGDGENQRFVINLIGQFYPGRPKYPDSVTDGLLARQRYFKECLEKIEQIHNLESIAFPYKIGCGAAGGDWNIYWYTLVLFAERVPASVVIYQWP